MGLLEVPILEEISQPWLAVMKKMKENTQLRKGILKQGSFSSLYLNGKDRYHNHG